MNVLVHDRVDIIPDVDLVATVDDSLKFVEQLVHVHSLVLGQFVESNLAVGACDEINFDVALAGHGAHAEVLGPLNLVLVDMALDEFDKLLSISFSLALAHSRNELEFVKGDGIGRCHCL